VPDSTSRSPRPWQALALLSCALFLASIARFYHPRDGFSVLIGLPAGTNKLPALAALPHAVTDFPYDGQFYAQLAMEPLLRDPAIDRALDQPPYRARRILFSWTAWLAGMGRPAWILQAYALQNVAAWLLLAWILTRWVPPRSGRLFAAWAACLFSPGLLWSVRFSLLDGPSMLLLAGAVIAAESGRTWLLGSMLGAAALGRETNLLGAAMLQVPRSGAGWLGLAGALALAGLPLLIWQDYLWSIYRTTSFAGSNQLTLSVAPYLRSWKEAVVLLSDPALQWLGVRTLLVVAALTTQLLFVILVREPGNVWWRLAAPFAVLMLIAGWEVWRGFPAAITRVALPLTFAFNIRLASRDRSFWPWYLLGNLYLIPVYAVLL
jgi:hypothetical protein